MLATNTIELHPCLAHLVGKIFINGAEQKNLTLQLNHSTPWPDRLGFRPVIGLSKKVFIGYMDDYYIFNKALNETEVLEVAESCGPGKEN